MKVKIKDVQEEDGDLVAVTTATVELVGDRLVLTGPPEQEAFLKNYLTFDADGNEHDWTSGRPWLEALPRSMAHGTYYGAVPATT